MKTSVVLMVALWANTTLLLSESLLFLTDYINTWILAGAALLLIAIYYAHTVSNSFEKVRDIKILKSDIYTRGDPKPRK